jgi:glycosyltransferase involved in cell wall biosynthesis
MTRPNLLIVSHDVVGSQMAGPGIRYYHLARVLAAELPVTLAVPGAAHDMPDVAGVKAVAYTPHDWTTLAPLVARATVALFPSDLVAHFPQLAEVATPLVIDGYNPILAEWLAVYAQQPPATIGEAWQNRLASGAASLRVGDFFICASERQRDWWLGQLEAHGRINPATYGADPTLRRLVDVLPYGLPLEEPVATRPMIKGVWPHIAPSDKVVLWGGGLWPWLDPLTAIRAMSHLAATRPEIKLIFPGTRHPNPAVATMPTHLAAAQALAATLGLTDHQLFFGEWVAFADWPSVLLESDVALTLHGDSVETRLAFRSRVLDYVWAGLPVIATEGDATSDLIGAYKLGIQVRAHDAEGVAAAIVALVDEPRTTRAAAFARARTELNWERAAAPLAAFCRNPQRAPDRVAGGAWTHDLRPLTEPEKIEEAHIDELHAEVAHWRNLVVRYEEGRLMRLMRWLAQLRRKLGIVQ